MSLEIMVFGGIIVFLIVVTIIVRVIVNKASDAIENKYARHKNKNTPTGETKLADLYATQNIEQSVSQPSSGETHDNKQP